MNEVKEQSSTNVLGRGVRLEEQSSTSLLGRRKDESSMSLLGRRVSIPPSKLQIVFQIFLGIIIILHIAALATPWWLYAEYKWEECQTDVRFSWQTISVTCNDHTKCTYLGLVDFCDTQMQAVDKKNWRTQLYNCDDSAFNLECQTLPHIFDGILAMTILSMLTSVVLLAILLLKERTSILPEVLTTKKVHLAISTLACIFSLIAIIVYGVAIPAAYHNANRCSSGDTVGCDFVGEIEINLPPIPKMTLGWGPGPGWVVELVNLAMMVGFLFLYALRG